MAAMRRVTLYVDDWLLEFAEKQFVRLNKSDGLRRLMVRGAHALQAEETLKEPPSVPVVPCAATFQQTMQAHLAIMQRLRSHQPYQRPPCPHAPVHDST